MTVEKLDEAIGPYEDGEFQLKLKPFEVVVRRSGRSSEASEKQRERGRSERAGEQGASW